MFMPGVMTPHATHTLRGQRSSLKTGIPLMYRGRGFWGCSCEMSAVAALGSLPGSIAQPAVPEPSLERQLIRSCTGRA